jgi:hypothetical protein
MRQLWSLKWDNHLKAVYWRLVHNGLPTAARMHQDVVCGVCQQPAAAGGPRIGRQHHFWECPVAQAVVAAVRQQLTPAWCSEPVSAHHVMCMHPPAGSACKALHAGVWRVVCLAAVCAMEEGRRAAYRAVVEEREAAQEQQQAQQQQQRARQVEEGQQRITDLLQPAALLPHQQQHQQRVQQRREERQREAEQQRQQQQAARLEETRQAAVATFFALLQDFVAVQAAPREWLLSVPGDHPFLRTSQDRSSVQGVAAVPPANEGQ